MLDWLLDIDFRQLFVPSISPLEGILRISIVYLSIFFTLRFVLKREAASLGISDLLVVVLIADAVQNAMADSYTSVTDGLILAGTLVFWDWFLSYAAMRWRTARVIIRPAPLLLIRDGRIIWHNLGKEHLTEDELLSQLRLQGVESVDEVKLAFMETDGRISVIPRQGHPSHPDSDRRGAI